MKRIISVCAAVLLLVGCNLPGVQSPGSSPPSPSSVLDTVASLDATMLKGIQTAPPATLSRVTIDDTFIRAAFKTFDALLYGVDFLIDTRRLIPGSPAALRVRGYLVLVKHYLNAASAAQQAGSTTSYAEAFRQAQKALADVRSALAEGGGN